VVVVSPGSKMMGSGSKTAVSSICMGVIVDGIVVGGTVKTIVVGVESLFVRLNSKL